MTSVRLAATRALVAAINDEAAVGVSDPTKVQVVGYDPGKHLQRTAIYVVDVTGSSAAEYLAGGTDTATSDDFTISVVCRSFMAGDNPAAAMDRVDELYVAVRRAVLGSSHGGDLDGLTGVSFAEISRVEGPFAGPDDNGYLALCRIDVRINTDEVTP